MPSRARWLIVVVLGVLSVGAAAEWGLQQDPGWIMAAAALGAVAVLMALRKL